MRLTATDLAATRSGRRVFSGVSFAAGPGELVAVTGPNGAGKSTLLRVVAGLLQPSAGSVTAEPAGEDDLATRIHYLGHLDALKPALSVRQNLDFWRHLWSGGEAPDRVLDAVGLGHVVDLPAGVLSAGQRRRVAIARLLIAPRPVWLLDEPATALDAAAEERLGRLIADHLAGGGLALAATHRDLPVPPAVTISLGEAS